MSATGAADIEAHPVVAELAASLVRDKVTYPAPAIEKVRAALRADAQRDTIARQLIMLGMKAHRIAGEAADPLLIQLATLVAESLGSAAAAADAFARAGMSKDVADRIGGSTPTRAPEERAPPPQQVKARRGLS
jgi:hypothetical protein